MRVLVLGGTAWLGGEIARAAGAGARGHLPGPGPRGVGAGVGCGLVAADRDQPGAYDRVSGQEWDDVVDVSWQPGQVRSALAGARRAGRALDYVSSCSVYADHRVLEPDETRPLLPALEATRPPGGSTARPRSRASRGAPSGRGPGAGRTAGLIGGYGDRSDRFGYWPGRFELAGSDGGQVLVPDAGRGRPRRSMWATSRPGSSRGAAGITGTVDA